MQTLQPRPHLTGTASKSGDRLRCLACAGYARAVTSGVGVLVTGIAALLLATKAKSVAARSTAAAALAFSVAAVLSTAAVGDAGHWVDLLVVVAAAAAIASFLLSITTRTGVSE